jgi:hypothetical protein
MIEAKHQTLNFKNLKTSNAQLSLILALKLIAFSSGNNGTNVNDNTVDRKLIPAKK